MKKMIILFFLQMRLYTGERLIKVVIYIRTTTQRHCGFITMWFASHRFEVKSEYPQEAHNCNTLDSDDNNYDR